jgi:RecB family endonuclease NucS
MPVTIEVGDDDANMIAVECLKSYYLSLYEEVELTQEFNILLSLDDVMSHFMTEREYEEFANGLRENTYRV